MSKSVDQDQAARLKKAREEAGFLDATSAARAFGWTIPTYLSHENGSRGFKSQVAKRYAAVYKVSAAWLISGEGQMRGPGIDAQLVALPPAVSKHLIELFNQMIANVQKGRRIEFAENDGEPAEGTAASTRGKHGKTTEAGKRRL